MDSTAVNGISGQEIMSVINAIVTAVIVVIGFLNRHNIFRKG